MSTLPYHLPGTAVVFRSVHGARVGYVRTLTVVSDTPALLALYIQPGAPCRRRAGVRGGPRNRVLLGDYGSHEAWEWTETEVLVLWRPGDAYTVSLFRRAATGEALYWYIDLIEPPRRSVAGFDIRDHTLDLVVALDRSSWQWKDEDEFSWKLEQGQITPQEGAAIRSTGERALAQALSGEAPFGDEWLSWEPDPSWGMPVIPQGWNRVD